MQSSFGGNPNNNNNNNNNHNNAYGAPPPLPARPNVAVNNPNAQANNGPPGMNVWQMYVQSLGNQTQNNVTPPRTEPSVNVPSSNPFLSQYQRQQPPPQQPQQQYPQPQQHQQQYPQQQYPQTQQYNQQKNPYPGAYSQQHQQSSAYGALAPQTTAPYAVAQTPNAPFVPPRPNQNPNPFEHLVRQKMEQQFEQQEEMRRQSESNDKNNAKGLAFLQGLLGFGQKVSLSFEQKHQFVSEGFLHIPNVVPKPLVDRALRAINRHLAIPASEQKLQALRSVTSCPDLVASKVIMDLLTHSPALAYIESMLGKINFPRSGQIALRYPGDGCLLGSIEKFTGPGMVNAIANGNPLVGGVLNQLLGSDDEDKYYAIAPEWHKWWHIDGFPQSVSGLKTGEVKNFTMLIGILLADAPEENMGNLTVFPGSHHLLERFFREQVPSLTFGHKGGIMAMSQQSLFDGIKYVVDSVQSQMPPPHQLRGRAGDIFLAHYQLPHAIAPNTSPYIRYACYFRIHHARHALETPKPDVMTDIWCDFDGLSDLTQSLREKRS